MGAAGSRRTLRITGAWFVAVLAARSTFIGATATAASSLPPQAVVPATRTAVEIHPMIRIGSPLLNGSSAHLNSYADGEPFEING
jgi:hypothetical protein